MNFWFGPNRLIRHALFSVQSNTGMNLTNVRNYFRLPAIQAYFIKSNKSRRLFMNALSPGWDRGPNIETRPTAIWLMPPDKNASSSMFFLTRERCASSTTGDGGLPADGLTAEIWQSYLLMDLYVKGWVRIVIVWLAQLPVINTRFSARISPRQIFNKLGVVSKAAI